MDEKHLTDDILRLKSEKDAVLLVHNYQRGEIQELADYLGDSLGLSRQAARVEAGVIVFCGVRFMAETAKILSPGKKVLLPRTDAGCPMAGMVDAEGLRNLKSKHPEAVVDLVGYSGGGGLAIMVAEVLPEGVHLRNVVLAQPALSPDYDLCPALSRIDGKLVNFYSPYDWLILGLGTRVFGTMDRQEVASAGKERFDLRRAVRKPELRGKVEQRGWELRQVADGHFGDHFSILSYWWNRRHVAPYLLDR